MFIDEWFGDNFYKKLPLGYHNPANFCFGQMFWTHAYYPHENLELWRPVPDPAEPTKTIASQFRITAAGKDAFSRSLPLHVPRLETNEEFIVVRAKVRPVILIQTELPLAGVDNKGYRGRIQRHRPLIGALAWCRAHRCERDARFPIRKPFAPTGFLRKATDLLQPELCPNSW